MSALIFKDILVLKKTVATYFLMLAFFVVFGVMNKNTAFFQVFIIVMMYVLPITALSYDERCGWEKFALTTPIKKRDLVLGKYVMGILCIICAAIVSTLVSMLVMPFIQQKMSLEAFASIPIGLAVAMVMLAISLPIMFFFGTEKGRIVNMLCLVLIGFVLPLLVIKTGFGDAISADMITILVVAAPVVALVLLGISAFITCRFYERKEIG